MSELLKCPSVPAALLSFFAHQPDFAALAGDMSEEFHRRVRTSGVTAAKLWYWREAFRNAGVLTARELFSTPARTAIIAIGCVVALGMVTSAYFAIKFFVSGSQFWSPIGLVLNHSDRNALLPLQFGAALVLGWAGGRLLPGREWGLTLTFAFVYACISLPAAWYLFFAPNVVLPAPQQEFLIAAVAPAVPPPVMIAALGLRLSGFAFGSLCIRQSRLNRHLAR